MYMYIYQPSSLSTGCGWGVSVNDFKVALDLVDTVQGK